MMNTNPAGIGLIKSFEGLKLRACRCPANVLTIGFGHTGPNVREGMAVTEAGAEDLLRRDLGVFEQGVEKALGAAALVTTGNQFAALVSLAYNIGLGAFRTSSVLREHKEGHTYKASACFRLWCKAGGKELPGLLRRREAEAALYLGPDEKPEDRSA